jgi:surface protein
VDQVSCIDGSVKQIATYDQASSNPTFLDYAGGDLAVVFNNGSVKFSDNGTVVGTDDSITSTEAVTLKQTVTDQNGEFVVGSATAEPAYVETPFTVSSPHRWLSSINSGVEQNEDVSFYPVVFEGGHPLSNYNRYQINAVTDEGTVLYNGVYDNSGSRKKFKVKKPGETFRVTYTATCNDYSLEVVTDPVNIIHEKPWKGWPGGVFHIRGVTDNNKIINLGDISLTVYMIENNQVQALSGGVTQIQISKTREAVVCAYAQTSGIFSNNNNEFVFGEFTDISRTNTLNRLLFNCSAFNDPSIASWSVNNITNMNQMFGGCSAFNQDITRWDVQNVSNMNYMFQDCSSFNQDLSNWCVYRFTEEPDGFSSGTDSWSLPKPPWGSCGQN